MGNRTTALRATTVTVPPIGHNNPPAAIGDPTTASVPTSTASPVFDATTAAPESDTSAKLSLKDDVLFGAQAIADELGLEQRKTFYLLERGYLPATKCGATWTSTRSRLRRFFDGGGL